MRRGQNKKSILMVLIIILSSTASFGLGKMSVIEKYRSLDEVSIITPDLGPLNVDESLFKFVASKNGTKYYPVNCKSASRIKDENKIYFMSGEEAEDAGLEKTSTCSF